MQSDSLSHAFEQLIADLTPRYGAGEARSIARIVFEDEFDSRKPAEKVLTGTEITRFWGIHHRLLQGEPVQYVLGQADFFGLKITVTPAVLIPRQETEELVAWILDWLKKTTLHQPEILDIGLGSGCIAIALKAKRPDIRLFGLEKSPGALDIAVENARRVLPGADITFLPGDILDQQVEDQFPKLDVIVSNPPYIPWQERSLIPDHVLRHEPEMALFTPGEDSLVFYRAIARFAGKKLRNGGALFFECNEFNTSAVVDLLWSEGFKPVEMRRDLAGADRMVMGQFFSAA